MKKRGGGFGGASRGQTRSSGSFRGGKGGHQDSKSDALNHRIPNADAETANAANTCGVYKNKMLTYAVSAAIGMPMTLATQTGKVFEGIFTTFSPDFEIVLEQVAEVKVDKVDDKDATANNNNHDQPKILDKMVFPSSQIVHCTIPDVDLDFATRDGFLTDTQISATPHDQNGDPSQKELVEWVPEDEDDLQVDLDLGGSGGGSGRGGENGWAAEDMFKRNESKYGVQSTYKDNLEGYTMQLSKDKNSEEYRQREAKAASIAREIEGDFSSQNQVELENGDEEEAFSAVVRPSNNQGHHHNRHGGGQEEGGSKYLPPAKRQTSRDGGGAGSGRSNQGPGGRYHQPPPSSHHPQRSTPPPHHSYSSSASTPPNATSGSSSSHRDRDHQAANQQDDYGRGARGGDQRSYDRRSGGGYNDQQMGPRHHRGGGGQGQQQFQHQGGKPQQVSGRDKSDHSVDHRGAPSSSGASSSRGQGGPLPMDHGGRANPAASKIKQESPMNNASNQPTKGRMGGYQQKSHEDIVNDIKSFKQNFKLSLTGNEEESKNKAAKDIPLASAATQDSSSDSVPSEEAKDTSSSSTTTVSATESNGSTASLAKKSTLNPNAKEFNFNPNAKPFVPGTPRLTATPPRPQTPATPTMMNPQVYQPNLAFVQGQQHQHQQQMLAAQLGYPGASYAGFPPHSGHQQQHVPPPHPNSHAAAAAAAAAANQQRFRAVTQQGVHQPPNNVRVSGAMNAPSSEMPSPIQVAAATGPPLMQPAVSTSGQQQNFMQFNPHQQAGMNNAQTMMMRLPAGQHVMVQTSLPQSFLSQQHQGHPDGGPTSLPWNVQTQQHPPPVVPPNGPPPPQHQQPGTLTPTPPSSVNGPPPPHAAPSPGQQQHIMFSQQPQSLPPQMPNYAGFFMNVSGPNGAINYPHLIQQHPSTGQPVVSMAAVHPHQMAALAAMASQHQQQPYMTHGVHGQQPHHPMMMSAPASTAVSSGMPPPQAAQQQPPPGP